MQYPGLYDKLFGKIQVHRYFLAYLLEKLSSQEHQQG